MKADALGLRCVKKKKATFSSHRGISYLSGFSDLYSHSFLSLSLSLLLLHHQIQILVVSLAGLHNCPCLSLLLSTWRDSRKNSISLAFTESKQTAALPSDYQAIDPQQVAPVSKGEDRARVGSDTWCHLTANTWLWSQAWPMGRSWSFCFLWVSFPEPHWESKLGFISSTLRIQW